jgi:hypothetical protein
VTCGRHGGCSRSKPSPSRYPSAVRLFCSFPPFCRFSLVHGHTLLFIFLLLLQFYLYSTFLSSESTYIVGKLQKTWYFIKIPIHFLKKSPIFTTWGSGFRIRLGRYCTNTKFYVTVRFYVKRNLHYFSIAKTADIVRIVWHLNIHPFRLTNRAYRF